ncbi:MULTISPECIES: ABC transporter permease [Halorussus]|uniref:ABC transporter permease n=1 Tax=Halorussus TaxID=1070314 RepID=UPI000E21A317|nr:MULTISPECIES: ABC transporter permease [Halorussus]NHN61678.1 ABC transporter permease [Halorussus sp. JP-T4]
MSTTTPTLRERVQRATDDAAESVRWHWSIISQDYSALIGTVVLAVFIFLGFFGPYLAPHHPIEDFITGSDGSLLRLSAPTQAAPMGTTQYGKDIFSQFLAGARPTLIAGFVGGFLSGMLGFLVGLTAGYYGGYVDQVLMRLTDLTFAVPALPIELLLLTFVEPNIWIIAVIILALLWKLTARVVRSEVLSVKERTFVKSARASGAGNLRTMFLHVAPNVLPIGLLYSAYSTAWAITAAAGLAFLGFGDPTKTSWGRMLRASFEAGAMRSAWWWVLPPAIGIAAVTVSVFFVGRAYEEEINPELKSQ